MEDIIKQSVVEIARVLERPECLIFLSVEPFEQRVVLNLTTDGLGLEEKLQAERLLKVKLEGPLEGRKLIVNFRRKTTLSAGGITTHTPAPVRSEAQPYGLKVNKRAIPGVREVIVVASGKGGVGKSTVSANLAAALAHAGKRVGLLDADVYGPSAPTMYGVKGPFGVSSAGRLVPTVAHGVKIVSFGFMSDERNPVIWRGPLVAKALEQFCYEVEWGELDYLVVDFPPGTGDVQITLLETLPIHHAYIVTTPQDVALIDAHKALSMFERLDVPVRGLIENMSYHLCGECGHKDFLFGHAVEGFLEERKLKRLLQVPLNIDIRVGGDRGVPIALCEGSEGGMLFRRLADSLLSSAIC